MKKYFLLFLENGECIGKYLRSEQVARKVAREFIKSRHGKYTHVEIVDNEGELVGVIE